MAVAIEPRHLRCTENWAHNIDLALRYSITLIRIQHCLHGFQWIPRVFDVYKSQVMHIETRGDIGRDAERGYNGYNTCNVKSDDLVRRIPQSDNAALFARL